MYSYCSLYASKVLSGFFKVFGFFGARSGFFGEDRLVWQP